MLAAGALWGQQYLITTVAGGGSPPTPAPAASTSIAFPQAVALDSSANLYFAAGNAVYKVDATGVLTRVAGSARPGYSGDNGPATAALLNQPAGLALDAAGNLYVADTGNNAIRRVSATGVISTLAPSAGFESPAGLALDAAGNLYVADSGNNAVREVDSTSAVSTVSSAFSAPYGVAVDAAGNLYIADTGNGAIRKLAAGGVLTTVEAALGNPRGVAVDAAGSVYIADTGNGAVRKVDTKGAATTLTGGGTLGAPYGVAVDLAGNVFIADAPANLIRKLPPKGALSIVAGDGGEGHAGDGGPATAAQLAGPYGLAVVQNGLFLIADLRNNRVRRVTPDGTIVTIMGDGNAGYAGDGASPSGAEFRSPWSLAVDALSDLYIADLFNYAIRELDRTDTVSTIAGNGTPGYSGDGGAATAAQLGGPHGIAFDGTGNLFIADTPNNVIRRISPSGTISTVATGVSLHYPYNVALDAAGNLYIADSGNAVIRKMTAKGTITVAGNGAAGFSGDNGPATSAQLEWPWGIAVDGSGNLFIADNGRIREVSPSGIITTIAGGAAPGYSGDGGPATSAQFGWVSGVAVDGSGNVYVSDAGNNAIRMLVPAGARALLSVSLTLSDSFAPAQTGATYSIVVSNAAAAGPTAGAVSVTNLVPPGLTLVSMAGQGWTCGSAVCTRSDALAAGAVYPPIAVTVNVATNPPAQVDNIVTVTGGGSPAASAEAPANIVPPPAPPLPVSPANGSSGVALTPSLVWNASSLASAYDVYFGPSSPPPLAATTTDTTYAPGTLNWATTYYWQIVARNGSGTAASDTWSFTTGAAPPAGLRFVALTPCRVADTRNAAGPFGGPEMAAGETRSFAVPQSACNVPASAQAYSMNVTVVPGGPLSYLTLWPSGQSQPTVSTLNSPGGAAVANAAIVPAGTGGAVSVYVTDATEVILDIDGYFDSSTGPESYFFYPVTPCRVADTRGPTGVFGGPSMYGGQTRDFPILLSPCGLPAIARAYSFNVTVVPSGYLGYLTARPTGGPQPTVSTLNSWDGAVVANAAIVPAGTNESVSIYVSNPTDVILDIDGYFAPSSAGALSFYPVAPCRVVDTRNAPGPFGGPEMDAGTARSFAIPAGACNIPATAAAYSLNITAAPDAPLPYLTAWPAGAALPQSSTLNAWGGGVTANAAIVPAGVGGAIGIYVTGRTNVIIDVNGYFAP